MTFLALDVGNTRLKWAVYETPQVGAKLLAHGAQFLKNIQSLSDGDWSKLPEPTCVLGCVLAGDPVAYALCRPPGHHAFADMAGGFCFLNNSAIAAERLRSVHPRIAILDVDVHHGNGTQAIFYRRADVMTVSVHVDPRHYYPFFWGHAEERGEGEGEGFNVNVPLPLGTGDDDWLAALARTLPLLEAHAPGALVVALGLDAYKDDPLQGMNISTAGFARIAACIAELGLPTVLVQEGGYPQPQLGANLASFLGGFEAAVKLGA